MIELENILSAEKHVKNYKTIIFDLDDTLYSEKEYVKSGFCAVGKILPQIENAAEKLQRFFEEKKSPIDSLLMTENIFTPELKEKCLECYRFHTPSVSLYGGVCEMLERLRAGGHNLGIVTDGRSEGQRKKLAALELENLVDYFIVTDELGGIEYRKPNPLAFEKMSRHFGTDFSDMCYVGDNAKKDFVAPMQLGMGCIWFKNPDGLYFGAK